MWPLDISIAALAGLVLYLIVTRLRFDDPRWLFNAWTYAIAVPVIALALAFVSHGLVSRYIQKSIQIGFLFSVCVHLLLLILAINVIIFSHYFPEAFTGAQRQRTPVSRTVPEYLFRTAEETSTIPDWSQPVDVATTSRVVPQEQRQVPPLEMTRPKLELPKPRETELRPVRKHLMKRDQPAESLPQPTEQPARLARQRVIEAESTSASAPPSAPEVPLQREVLEPRVERDIASTPRRQQASSSPASAAPPRLPPSQEVRRSLEGMRSRSREMPVVGQSGLRRQQRQPRRSQRAQPAGAAPAPPAVAVAQQDASADRVLAPVELPITRQAPSVGAQLTMGQTAGTGPPSDPSSEPDGGLVRSDVAAAASGMPNVAAGRSRRAPGRGQRPPMGFGFQPLGVPQASESMAAVVGEGETEDLAQDRFGLDSLAEPSSSRSSSRSITPALSRQASIALDLPLDTAPPGLGSAANGRTGVVSSEDQPVIASLDLTPGRRQRRELGGPVTPLGTEIAAVESFNRRIMRTRRGAPPTPAGLVGPATEEAIERGLAYLASVQNKDGSWSLQGHGGKVLLRSDTAATGLCLLAFQGAGYTHRQHQYADTVSRGLKFLMDNQRTNGDLYRQENTISDQNVALYSHGIAALAVCEAYGMTQDDELKEAAQLCLDYIVGTQHRQRGGWRYTPQISADTSVTGWMMMALKSGQLAGLEVPDQTYRGIGQWLSLAQSPNRPDRYRYNPFAPDTPTQRHGRVPTPTMTSVGMLMRMYSGWRRDNRAMQSAAEYLLKYPPQMGTARSPQRDAYYWYYATQVMFHMGDDYWERWNRALNPLLLESQIDDGPDAGSWDPRNPVPDRWAAHAGRLYVTTMNLLNLEVYYRHLPIYEDTAE